MNGIAKEVRRLDYEQSKPSRVCSQQQYFELVHQTRPLHLAGVANRANLLPIVVAKRWVVRSTTKYDTVESA
jgi:hypothetical protein